MVSSSSNARSEIVGWMAGSKLDEMASSEHLRKPKKARINMASSVRAVGIVCEKGVGWEFGL